MRTVLVVLLALPALAQAADGGSSNKPAEPQMPTDAQCLPLPALARQLSFGPGEVLEYDVDALGAVAAQMTMRTLPLRDGRLPIEAHVETNTFFNKVRKVVGTGTSYVDPKTLKPLRYYEDALENETHRVADVKFDPRSHEVWLRSTINDTPPADATFKYLHDGTDVVGTIFLMRQLPLKKDLPLCFDAYGIRRLWRVWGAVVAREHVSLPVGEFEAWHIAGYAAPLNFPQARREIHVWISDDSRRLPLAAMGVIDLGTVRATLKAFRRPGEKQARAENRGNLKW